MKKLIYVAVLVALVVVAVTPPSTLLAAPPTRIPLDGGSVILTGVCAFPVMLTSTAMKEYLTIFTDRNGAVTMQLFTGEFKSTFTNMTTGYSQSYNISGPSQITYNPDGGGQQKVLGTALFLGPANNLANLPSLALFDGSLTFQFDPQGNVTAASFAGHSIDECAALNH